MLHLDQILECLQMAIFNRINFINNIPVDYLIAVRRRQRSLINPTLIGIDHVDQLAIGNRCNVDLRIRRRQLVQLKTIEETVNNFDLLIGHRGVVVKLVKNDTEG